MRQSISDALLVVHVQNIVVSPQPNYWVWCRQILLAPLPFPKSLRLLRHTFPSPHEVSFKVKDKWLGKDKGRNFWELFSANVCTRGVFSGVCAATSAVVTGRLSRAPSQSGPEASTRTEQAWPAGIGLRPQQRQVKLHRRPHPVKWTKGKWIC